MSKAKNHQLINLNDFLPVLRALRKNLLLILVFPIIFGLAGFFYTYKLPDIYGGTAQILLKSSETYDYQENIYKSLGYYSGYGDISNQMRVLKSRNLVEVALDKLNFGISYYVVGRVKTDLMYNDAPFKVKVTYLDHRLYGKKIGFKVLDRNKYRLTYKVGEDVVEQTYTFGMRTEKSGELDLLVTQVGEWSEATLQKCKEAEYYFEVHRKGEMVGKYLAAMQVSNVDYTSILKVDVEDENPQRAVAFLDTLAEVYIEYTLQSKVDVNLNTLSYIELQLDEVVAILNHIEDTLERFKRNNAILNLTREENTYYQKLVDYDNQLRGLEIRMEALAALEEYVNNISTDDEKLLPSSFYIYADDDFLKSTIRDVYNLQMQRNQILVDATLDSPNIKSVDEQLRLLKKNLLVYIANSKEAVTERMSRLTGEIGDYETMIKRIPQTQRDLLNINRKLQVNEKLYLYLLEKKANTIIARAGIIPETRVIESARSLGVVGPDKQKNILLTIIAGFIFGGFIAFIRIVFFNRISTVEELTDTSTIPVLGHIFRTKEVQDGSYLIGGSSKSNVMESLRAVRTNLQYFAAETEHKVILVSSVGMSEGKTFCSVNLSAIFAKANKRVLLIELDMHKPKVYQAFLKQVDSGLSSFLIHKAEYEDVIESTEVPNLDVALCGPIPPNASELILSDRLEQFLMRAKEEYDYVIIDTPPVGLISDALVVMKYSNVNLFIFNTRTTRRQEVSFVEGVVEKNDLKNVGFILNNVKPRKWKKYYGRYGYGYGYGFGYGYGYGAAPEDQQN